jgi:hypothetical protein
MRLGGYVEGQKMKILRTNQNSLAGKRWHHANAARSAKDSRPASIRTAFGICSRRAARCTSQG